MHEELEVIKHLLSEGRRRTTQSSYERRAPARDAIPYLIDAKVRLKAYVKKAPTDHHAWRLLSHTEECLLNFSAAKRALEAAMAILGVRDRKDLKKLALLNEYEGKWSELKLSPEQLESMGRFIGLKLKETGCDHTLNFTKQWLKDNLLRSKGVISALRNHGGYCDCEVLSNVICNDT